MSQNSFRTEKTKCVSVTHRVTTTTVFMVGLLLDSTPMSFLYSRDLAPESTRTPRVSLQGPGNGIRRPPLVGPFARAVVGTVKNRSW